MQAQLAAKDQELQEQTRALASAKASASAYAATSVQVDLESQLAAKDAKDQPTHENQGGPTVEVEDPAQGCPNTAVIRPFRTRADLGFELRRLGLKGTGVELGVYRGLFTTTLLTGWRCAARYVMVDIWAPLKNYADVAGKGGAEKRDRDMMTARGKGEAMQKRGFTKTLELCRNFTTVCAETFADGSLDFVYVDARHDRKGVLVDLRAYWPKLKVGGVFAGHDYTEQREPNSKKEDPERTGQDWTLNYDGTRDTSLRVVKGAVDDFFAGEAEESPDDLQRCPRQITVSYRESGWNTWAVRK